ncbi:MAG TPA: sensor domain-containing diguanylate cyclase [Kineosporiaceae bacterium]|nr:sensor domain-containing diguanylate cyclase [Kineosporiaceae bacterium]
MTTQVSDQFAEVAAELAVHRRLAEHVADVVLVSEADVITWASHSVFPALGYRREDLIGLPRARLVHPDDLCLDITPGSPTTRARRRMRRADGSFRWFEVTITADFSDDGTIGALYSISRDVEDQVRLEGQREAAERRMREALDASLDGFAIYHAERDAAGGVTGLRLEFINAAGAAGFAGDHDGMVGRDLLDVYPEGAGNGLWQDMVAAVDSGRPQRRRIETVGRSWTGVVDSVQVRLETDTVLSTWRDVTELLAGERRLDEADRETAEVRATLQTALDATSDGFAVLDVDRRPDSVVMGLRVVHANAAALAGAGMTFDQIVGRDPREFLPSFVEAGMWKQVVASIAEHRPRQQRVHFADQTGRWTASWDTSVAPVGDHRLVLTFRDATADERVRRDQDLARRQAEHDAVHDPLTGLANRVLLRARLEEALQRCPHGKWLAVVYCDLDGFKKINDTHGHDAGDAILRSAADRLRGMIRAADTAARVGGDEFSLILRHLPSGWDSAPFAVRLAHRLAQPVYVHGRRLIPSASIGIAVVDPHAVPDCDRNPDLLLIAADQSMYRDKAVHRIRGQFTRTG